MRSMFHPLSCASLLLATTLSFASPSPAGAQSPQVAAPPSKPAAVTCSAGLKLCGCKGSADCDTLKKFAAAGGCSNPPRCTDDICVCDLDALIREDSPILTAARQHNLIKPGPSEKAPRPQLVRDCKADLDCNGTAFSCSVKGEGICQSFQGKMSCTQFFSDGSRKTESKTCGQ